MNEQDLPNGYEIRERHTLHEAYYYWIYAGGEQWGSEFVNKSRAVADAIRHAKEELR